MEISGFPSAKFCTCEALPFLLHSLDVRKKKDLQRNQYTCTYFELCTKPTEKGKLRVTNYNSVTLSSRKGHRKSGYTS